MKVVVIGSSISGLAFSVFAARRGIQVSVLDADPMTDPALRPCESLARNPRRPTPQSAHSHAFLARSNQIFKVEAPEVLDAFATHGVESIRLADHLPDSLADRTERPGDDDLVVLRSRRSTFENALRAVAASEPGVVMQAGIEVTDLAIDQTGTLPHVTGVRTSNGDIEADMVIDASGRRGRTFAWLEAAGISAYEDVSDCGIAYYTRFYRRYFGERGGQLNRGYTAGSSFDRYSALVFPGDNQSFSVTFGILPEDAELRKLRHDESFSAAAAAIPVIADWVGRGEPISGVRSMTGMKNRLRRLVKTTASGGRQPLVTGLVPIGDATGISNPAHSRGCSLAITHALAVAELLEGKSAATTRAQITEEADEIVARVIVPWVEDSRQQDEARLSRWRPGGGHIVPQTPPGTITNGEAWTAAHHDRDVWSRFTRLQQLLLAPEDVLADSDTVDRVRRVQERGLGLPRLVGPTHSELAQILALTAPASRRVGSATLTS